MEQKKRKKQFKNKKKYLHVGQEVFFHAFSNSENKSVCFLCKGYVTRQPKKYSPIYKVVPTHVNIKVQPEDLKNNPTQLLGKIIPKEESDLFLQKTQWMDMIYPEIEWAEIEQKEKQRVLRSIRRAQNKRHV